jgi:hypothetical protein
MLSSFITWVTRSQAKFPLQELHITAEMTMIPASTTSMLLIAVAATLLTMNSTDGLHSEPILIHTLSMFLRDNLQILTCHVKSMPSHVSLKILKQDWFWSRVLKIWSYERNSRTRWVESFLPSLTLQCRRYDRHRKPLQWHDHSLCLFAKRDRPLLRAEQNRRHRSNPCAKQMAGRRHLGISRQQWRSRRWDGCQSSGECRGIQCWGIE